VQAFQAARQQVPGGDATYDLKNQAGNVQRYSSFWPTPLCYGRLFRAAFHGAEQPAWGYGIKKPALRRQRILWRRRVGDASAKPTSAVKMLEKFEIMSHLFLISHRTTFILHALKAKIAYLHFES
jgi:hypothetical protein